MSKHQKQQRQTSFYRISNSSVQCWGVISHQNPDWLTDWLTGTSEFLKVIKFFFSGIWFPEGNNVLEALWGPCVCWLCEICRIQAVKSLRTTAVWGCSLEKFDPVVAGLFRTQPIRSCCLLADLLPKNIFSTQQECSAALMWNTIQRNTHLNH